jgi:hypothetical protein
MEIGRFGPRADISAVAITDTTREAAALQLEVLRSMSGEQRMALAYEMSMFARELAKAGIRRDHPDWSEDGRRGAGGSNLGLKTEP